MRYSLHSKRCYFQFLTIDDSADTFCDGGKKSWALRASLIFGVNECDVRQPDETQNVAQVGLLKIEIFHRAALFIGTSTGCDDGNFLSFEKAFPAGWPVATGLPDPHYLIDPRFQRRGN